MKLDISPHLLLVAGIVFAIFYAGVITIGWAVTRRNRKFYQNSVGKSTLTLFDMSQWKPLTAEVNTVSVRNNRFVDKDNRLINVEEYDCYIVGIPSSQYPKILKGDLIMLKPGQKAVAFTFRVPDLTHYR